MGGPGTRYRSSVQVLCNSPSDLQSVTGPKFPRTGVDCRYCTAGPPHPCLSNENWILTKLQSSVTLSGLITFFTIIQNVPYRAVLVFNLVYNQVFIGYMNSKLQTKHWWWFYSQCLTFFGQNCGHSYRVVDVGSLEGVLTSLIAVLDGGEVGSAEEVAGARTPAHTIDN